MRAHLASTLPVSFPQNPNIAEGQTRGALTVAQQMQRTHKYPPAIHGTRSGKGNDRAGWGLWLTKLLGAGSATAPRPRLRRTAFKSRPQLGEGHIVPDEGLPPEENLQ